MKQNEYHIEVDGKKVELVATSKKHDSPSAITRDKGKIIIGGSIGQINIMNAKGTK